MDALPTLLEELKQSGRAQGNFLGFLHVLIGRKITRQSDNLLISAGMSWRDLANWLKKVRWDPDAVTELGLESEDLPPRDRQRYWYGAIAHARVDAPEAVKAGDRFAAVLQKLGYTVGPSPHA